MDDPEAVIATMDRADVETPVPGIPSPRVSRRGGALPAAEHSWRSPKVITSAVSGSLLLLGWAIRLADGRQGTATCASRRSSPEPFTSDARPSPTWSTTIRSASISS